MSENMENQEATEEKPLSFEVMPGAEPLEAPENISLSFDDPEPEPEKAEETEETTAEAEETEETEETTAEAGDDDDDTEPDEGDTEEEPKTSEEPEEELPLAAEKAEPEAKSPMVPKSRLDEVLAKQKALQKQVEEMKAAAEQPEEAPEEYDFDAKEIEYQALVLDGEAEKAVALRKEIRGAEKAQISWEMEQKMGQTVQQSQTATALQQAAADMEATYPVFDQNSDHFNEEYTNEVVELRDAFIIKGYDAVDALSRAVKYVVKDRDLDTAGEAEQPALAAASSEQTAKKKASVAKKLKAAEAQPPELEGEGSSSRGENVVDFGGLSEDEFDALPEATLRRLRGDIV